MSKERKQLRWAVSLPCLAGLAVGLVLGQGKGLAFCCMAAIIHESGHLLALKLLGGRIEAVGFRLSGAEIRYAGASLSYGKEEAVALAGPAANLLFGILCALAAIQWPSSVLYQLAGCQLVLGLFNLLPALPLDGGRICALLLESRFPLWGELWAVWLSGAIGLGMTLAGLMLLGRGGNITLPAAGGVILLGFLQKKTLHWGKKRVQ